MIDKKKLKLPAISEAGRQALELLQNDDIEFNYLADFLGKDPVITAAILKYANSPARRRKVEITNIRTAVSFLGKKTCKMIVGLTILQTFRSKTNPLMDIIWSHCVNVATIARNLATQLYPDLTDDIETTAMMHDMGMLIMAASFPTSYKILLNDCIDKDIELGKAEMETYGFTHDQVIEVLVPLLQLPSLTTKVITRFHNSTALIKVVSNEEKHLITCHLAHFIVSKYETFINGNRCLNENIPHDMDNFAFLLGISENRLKDLIEDNEQLLDLL